MTAPRIALLDNNSACLSLMHALLTEEGYRTLRCRPQDVRDAHALVRRFQPALVILDRWWQRGDDGWDLLKHLWADPHTTRIGLVLTCGKAVDSSLQTDVLRTMRCQVLPKPFQPHDLLAAIERALGQSPRARIAGDCAPAARPDVNTPLYRLTAVDTMLP